MAAGRIKGITIEIGANTTELTKALAGIDNSLRNTQANLRDINRALKFDPSNTALLKDKQTELSDEIAKTTEKLETEKQALEQMKNTEGFDANSKAARNLQTQIDLDTVALQELEAQARQASSVLGTQMQVAGQKIQEVGSKIKSVGDNIAGLGRNMTSTITAPVAGAFGASIKAAVDWETAFTGVKKTVDGTAQEYEQLANNIKKMATETASSKEDIAGVMEIAGQLGVSGVDNLTTFTKTMVELGDTTNLSAEEAATSLARFMNITGESTGDVDKIGSAIVDLGNNFATSESEITEMATRLASAGTIAGLSSTDILALAASMSSVGIQAEAGGTAMSQTLKQMANAVADFKDGTTEDLDIIASVTEMSAADFAATWEKDPITALQTFIKGLNNVKESGDNVFATLGEMGMSGIRQSNMLQSLALASDQLSGALETSSNAYKDNSALTEEASKRYETMAAKMSQLKERVKEVGIEIGETLMPYVEQMMDKIQGLIDKWNSLDSSQQQAILKFAAIAAAIGPVLVIIGTLISSVGSIVGVIGKAVGAVGTLISNFGGLSAVLGILTGPVGIVIGVIAALAAGFAYLFTTNEEFRNSIMKIITVLQNNFKNAIEGIKGALSALGEAFGAFMELLAPVFESIIQGVADFISICIATIEPIIMTVTNIIQVITAIIQAFIAFLNGDFDACFEYLKAAWDAFIQGVINFINIFVQAGIQYFKNFGINIKAIFKATWTALKETVKTKIDEIKENIETVWNAIKEWLVNTITEIYDKFKETFDKIKEAVTERITEVKEKIVEGMEEACDYISDLPGRFYDWGVDMIQGLIDGIKSMIGSLISAAEEVASTIASYIHFSVPDKGPLADADEYMPDFVDLMVRGINNGIPRLEGAMARMTGAMAQQMQGSNNVTATNNVSINVYGAQGQNVQELANEIEQIIANNVVRRGVAFG